MSTLENNHTIWQLEDGQISYYNEHNDLHREDGPAIEYTNGDKEWYLNGKLHREDGPARLIRNETHQEWYKNGQEHSYNGQPSIFIMKPTENYIRWAENGQNIIDISLEDGKITEIFVYESENEMNYDPSIPVRLAIDGGKLYTDKTQMPWRFSTCHIDDIEPIDED